MPLGKRGEGRTQFQGLAPESKINMPRTSGRAGWRGEGGPAQEEPEQGDGAASPVVVSFRTRQGRCRPPGQEGVLDLGLLAPCLQAVRRWQCQEGVARTQCPQVVLLPLNSPTGKCLT